MTCFVLDVATRTIDSEHASIDQARRQAVEMGPEYIVAEERDKVPQADA